MPHWSRLSIRAPVFAVGTEPGHPRRRYQVRTARHGDPYLPPGEWVKRAEERQGSWWAEWLAWLDGHSGEPVAPPPMGGPDADSGKLPDAPGSYVMME